MVSIAPVPGLARLILRADEAALPAAETAFGLAIPRIACHAAAAPPRAALWLGPDEYLLLLADVALPSTLPAMSAALAPFPHALVDITHRQLALRLAGPHAATLLNAGCPLDLDLAAFAVNACTRTLLGKAEIVLWRVGAGIFHLEAARSYMPYVEAFLAEARHGVA